MMKIVDARTRTRRCRRSANHAVSIYFYAAVIIFCSSSNGRDRGFFPEAESFQYYEETSSISKLRGGGAEEDLGEINLQTSSQSSSLLIGASSTSAAPNIPDSRVYDTGHMPPSRGLWNSIRLLRGGVEDEKGEDIIGETKDKESGPTTNLEGDTNETTSCPTSEVEVRGNSANSVVTNKSISAGEREELLQEANQGKDGGVLYSFFSLFRAPVDSEDSIERTINKTGTAQRRGDGNSAAAASPTSSTEGSEIEVQEGKCVEVSALAPATSASKAKVKPSRAKVNPPKAKVKSAVRKGADSTAFVVPPHYTPLSPSVEDGKKREDAKKTKASKGKMAKEEIADTKSTNASLNVTQDKENKTMVSNETVNNNTIPFSSNASSSAAKNAFDHEMHQPIDYTSSGYWVGIDLIASLGLSSLSDDLKISRALRTVRKATAQATGLHGFMSGKEYTTNKQMQDNTNSIGGKTSTVISIDEELGIHDSNALEAEMLAKRVASRANRRGRSARARRNNRPHRRWGLRRGQQENNPRLAVSDYVVVPALDTSPDALELRRRKRVEDIDRLLQRGQARLMELQCERDDLLCAPNPLFNYTKKYDPLTNHTFGDVKTTREFNFPSEELVDEYISELVNHHRLIRLNHTELWQSRSDIGMEDDEDEIVGDDLLTPGADASKLYENPDGMEPNRNKGGGGSWLLRTGFGNGGSLGEKLGETIETAAYKGVCSSVMMVFAQMLAGLHGVNVMSHSDIRTYIEEDPDLPPVDKNHGPLLGKNNNNYAQEAIKTAMHKGAKKKRKTKHSLSHKSSSRRHGHELSDDAFIQRAFVVETLISHCQISAPLLKLFPLDWQRAMVGNIVTLATAIVSDFADGLQVQMLGHALTVSFKPITEADLIQHIGVGSFRQNHRRTRPDEFEAAVLATAMDISESLSFLDGAAEWLERRVGGGVLRSQIGNLIARVVLTLVDEVLSGARLDLWSSQANGPRLYAALEYRTSAEI